MIFDQILDIFKTIFLSVFDFESTLDFQLGEAWESAFLFVERLEIPPLFFYFFLVFCQGVTEV